MRRRFNMKVSAIIPARAGSERIEDKNIHPFLGVTLIENKIKQLSLCEHVDEIVVGTNDCRVKDICKNYDVILLNREDKFCDEQSSTVNEMIYDMVSRTEADVILWSHCTNPLINSEIYDKAILKFLSSEPHYDSLLSVTKIQNHLWHRTKSGYIPLNYSPNSKSHPISDQLEPLYFQDGGIFIQRKSSAILNSYFFGSRPFLFKLDPYISIDVNEPQDIVIAESLAR